MAKRYIRLNFENAPSVKTPLSADTMNHIDKGIDDLDIYKVDTDAIANNLVTTEAGLVLDARQGKVLDDKIDMINNNLPNIGYTNEGIKNSIYRGKYLGGLVTASQYTAISSGTFTDLYIGDYWTIGGVNYRIAAFNYYTNTGDISVPPNHITIVPDTQLYAHVMNDTNITTGGYTGSKMYISGLDQAKTIINSAFSGHLLEHRQYLTTAVANGKANGGGWVDSTVEIMNEIMVYGCGVFSSVSDGVTIPTNYTITKTQLPLFALNPRMVNTRQSIWLRDVISASDFARMTGAGLAAYGGASTACGVRPAFSIF